MRVFAGFLVCALGAAAASAMPPSSSEAFGNTTALRDSPSIAGRPDAEAQSAVMAATDLSAGQPELAALMDKIEATRRMPAGSSPVASYARYYAWADPQKTKVTAIFTKFDPPGRRWVMFDELPTIADGGCSVIELIYDVKTGVIDDIYCNGIG